MCAGRARGRSRRDVRQHRRGERALLLPRTPRDAARPRGSGRTPVSAPGWEPAPRAHCARATLLPDAQDRVRSPLSPPGRAAAFAQRSAETSRCVVRPWQTASHQPERLSHGGRLRALPQGQRLPGLQGRGFPTASQRGVEPLLGASGRPGHPATGQQDPTEISPSSLQNANFPRET